MLGTSEMFINFSLLKSHVMIVCCLCLPSILVPLWVLAVWFSFSKPPISLLGPYALNRVDSSPGFRAGMSGQSTASFWLCDCLRVEHVISSRPMSFSPIAVTIGKEMCSFPPGATKLIVGKAGVPRGHHEGESTWELVRVSQYQRKQN